MKGSCTSDGFDSDSFCDSDCGSCSDSCSGSGSDGKPPLVLSIVSTIFSVLTSFTPSLFGKAGVTVSFGRLSVVDNSFGALAAGEV
jgi:hypothetical protein